MRKVFSQDNTCIRTGLRRTKNLKDMLVKSFVQPVTTPQTDNPGCFKCHRRACDACQNFLLPYRHIISVATGKSQFLLTCFFYKAGHSISLIIYGLSNRF